MFTEVISHKCGSHCRLGGNNEVAESYWLLMKKMTSDHIINSNVAYRGIKMETKSFADIGG